jgi:hypothetical protein
MVHEHEGVSRPKDPARVLLNEHLQDLKLASGRSAQGLLDVHEEKQDC